MTRGHNTWRIDSAIADGLTRAFDKIDEHVRAGEFTDSQVILVLQDGWGEDIANGWIEYIDLQDDGLTRTAKAVYIKEAEDEN